MKKTILLICMVGCILSGRVFASGSYDSMVIDSIKDAEQHKGIIQTMPIEDKNVLMRYLMRKELLTQFGQNNLPNGLTIKEAIQNQLLFEKEQKKKEKEKETKNLAKQKAFEKFNEKYPLTIVGMEVQKGVTNNEILVVSLSVKNNSDKSIIAIQPDIRFILNGDSKVIMSWKPEKFKNEIQPNEMGNFEFGLGMDDMFTLKIEKNPNQVKAIFEKAEILFSDGTVEKIEK